MISIYSVILVSSSSFTSQSHFFSFQAVWTLDEPLIFLYDSILHQYGMYPLSSMIESNIQLEPILDYLIDNHTEIIRYSGDTWSKRIFRPFWELYRTIISMFTEAPFISLLVIGIPASVISIICYCLCCAPNDPSASKNAKKKRKNGEVVEREDDEGSMNEEDDEEYEERIVEMEPKFIAHVIKPADARDIPTWPMMPEETSKSLREKKQD